MAESLMRSDVTSWPFHWTIAHTFCGSLPRAPSRPRWLPIPSGQPRWAIAWRSTARAGHEGGNPLDRGLRPHVPKGESGREDVRDIVLIASWATAVLTRRQSCKVCAPAASCLGSPSATLNGSADWDDGDGSWNGTFPSSTSSADCASATRSAPISMKHS